MWDLDPMTRNRLSMEKATEEAFWSDHEQSMSQISNGYEIEDVLTAVTAGVGQTASGTSDLGVAGKMEGLTRSCARTPAEARGQSWQNITTKSRQGLYPHNKE